MSRPNLESAELRCAYDAGNTDAVLRMLSNLLRDLRSDVRELIPKMGTYSNGDPLDQLECHLTLALSMLPEGR